MKKLIVGNWKMNYNPDLIVELAHLPRFHNIEISIAPPFSHIQNVRRQLPEHYSVCAQNVSKYFTNGPYTGEVSVEMLRNISCHTVIIGHSERRTIFKENENDFIRKIENSLSQGMRVIYCVGETAKERACKEAVIEKQLSALKVNQNLIIAYEPVWAIGTYDTPTNDEISGMVNFIRSVCHKKGVQISVLYGGSVNESNVKTLVRINELDGFLIGGASTKRDFIGLLNHINNFYDSPSNIINKSPEK